MLLAYPAEAPYVMRVSGGIGDVPQAVPHLDGKHVVFGELVSGIKVLDRMKSVKLLEPKLHGKPAPEERVRGGM